MFKVAFHDRLKQARLRTGMTQSTVANMLGVAKSTYSGYETGKSEPSMNSIANLLQFFEISADWLWQDEMAHQHENKYPKHYYKTEEDSIDSEDERQLLRLYRHLNVGVKETVLTTVRAFAENPLMRNDNVDVIETEPSSASIRSMIDAATSTKNKASDDSSEAHA